MMGNAGCGGVPMTKAQPALQQSMHGPAFPWSDGCEGARELPE